MKLLHLADLHIGKKVNEFSMLAEQEHVLSQIVAYVKEYRTEAVLISGDVYDRSVPGADAVKVFDAFLTALHESGAKVLLISGNHDSAERLDFAGAILKQSGVYLAGSYEGEIKRVELADEYGSVVFWLLPFLKPAQAALYHEGVETYTDAVREVLKAAGLPECCKTDGKRHVLLAHQFVTNAGQAERSDSEYQAVGGLDEIDVSLFEGFDYVALGHLHGAQAIGCDTVRYAGSPLKYSFSEADQKKSAALVTLGQKGETAVTLLPLTPIHDMRRIKGPLAALLAAGEREAAGAEDYMQVTLTDEEELYDPLGRLRDVYPNLMRLEFENSRTRAAQTEGYLEALPEEKTALELFLEFFEEQNGVPLNDKEKKVLETILEQEETA